jgi:diaminopimelate decarboxylase
VSEFFQCPSIQRPPGFIYAPSSGKKGGARQSVLRCERIPLPELAERFGTPLYIYSAEMIRERVRAFQKAFRGVEHSICYSVKANSNLSILRLLGKLGCGFDVVSGGELERVLRVDRRAGKRVVFSGVGKTVAEIESALKAGILLFNLESASELDAVARCAAKGKRTAKIAFRVNPDVPADTHPYISTGLHKHKFGVPLGESRELYARAAKAKYLQVAGVSVHIGSQITDFAPFAVAMERVGELVRQLRSDGHQIEYVDAGGGMGIDYRASGQEDCKKPVSEYAQAVTGPLRRLGVHLLLEPGRSIVGAAGVLLTRVLYRKTNGEKKFLVVDAGMNDLIRPSLYQAEHQIVPVQSGGNGSEVVDIVGPVCESGDFFARGREVPVVQEGELLAILDAGAYGMALASNYNTRPRPAEVLVEGKSAKVIRKREAVSDLLRLEL